MIWAGQEVFRNLWIIRFFITVLKKPTNYPIFCQLSADNALP